LVKFESPDFVLKVGIKKSIGIELTRLDENALTLKERIDNTLNKKNQKLANYKTKKFNAIWLIIHADFIEESKSYNINNKLAKWKFSFEFDKVFLFDLFNRTIFELIK